MPLAPAFVTVRLSATSGAYSVLSDPSHLGPGNHPAVEVDGAVLGQYIKATLDGNLAEFSVSDEPIEDGPEPAVVVPDPAPEAPAEPTLPPPLG